MKDIKFRGKRLDNGELIYGDLIHNGFDGKSRTIEIGIAKPGCYPIAVDPETLGQYTGIHDKNGKEIYESDKVSFTVFDCWDNDIQYDGYIVYSGSRFMIWNKPDNEYYGSDGGFDLDWIVNQDCEIEVIGNIFESEI